MPGQDPADSGYEPMAARLRRLSRLTVGVVLAALLALLMFVAEHAAGHAIFGFLFWLPLGAWFASRWLVGAGSALAGWSRRRVWAPVNGRHHALDDIWMRIEDDGRGHFRVLADDVFRFLEQPLDDRARLKLAVRFAAGGLFQDADRRWWFGEAALLDYLRQRAGRHDARALRLALWLEREALPPLRRQLDRES